MKKLIGLVVTLAIIGGLAAGAFALYGWANQLQMTAIAKETELSKQYLDNQNELGAYISSFYEQIGVANLKSDKMDKILLDAVKGRYEGHTSAQPGQGQLFSAITEAYPDLGNNMQLYDKIVDFIQKGREQYKGVQTKLLTELQDYDQWRKSGIVQSKLLAWAGVPTSALQAHLGAQVLTGEAAEKQMYVIVLPSEALTSYQTGVGEPLKVPGGN